MQKYCGIDNFATFTSSAFKLVYDRQGIDKIPSFVYVALEINPHYGLKSIFETDFKRHSEPRLPSTAQINH